MFNFKIMGSAWCTAFSASLLNPVAFISVLLAIFIIKSGFVLVGTFLADPAITHGTGPLTAALYLLQICIQAILVSPIILIINRRILLGEKRTTAKEISELRLLATYVLTIALIINLPIVYMMSQNSMGMGIGLLELVFEIIVVSFTVRLLLCFSALIMDCPKPFLQSWRLTKGRWWYVVLMMIVNFLPFCIFSMAIFTKIKWPLAPFQGYQWPLPILFGAIFDLILYSVSAALMSKLYLYFLKEPWRRFR